MLFNDMAYFGKYWYRKNNIFCCSIIYFFFSNCDFCCPQLKSKSYSLKAYLIYGIPIPCKETCCYLLKKRENQKRKGAEKSDDVLENIDNHEFDVTAVNSYR